MGGSAVHEAIVRTRQRSGEPVTSGARRRCDSEQDDRQDGDHGRHQKQPCPQDDRGEASAQRESWARSLHLGRRGASSPNSSGRLVRRLVLTRNHRPRSRLEKTTSRGFSPLVSPGFSRSATAIPRRCSPLRILALVRGSAVDCGCCRDRYSAHAWLGGGGSASDHARVDSFSLGTRVANLERNRVLHVNGAKTERITMGAGFAP